ncbi:MAG: transposase, partial [Desulfurococcales archaeon ex4484_42]
KSSTLANRLSRFAYCKLQLAIVTKAIEYNIPVIYVDPRGTSTLCPKCRAKLSYTHGLAICEKCGFMADRDTVGTMNVHLRGFKGYVGEPWVSPERSCDEV